MDRVMWCGAMRHGRESLHRGRAAQGGGVLRATRPHDRLGRDTLGPHPGRGFAAHLHAGVRRRGACVECKYHVDAHARATVGDGATSWSRHLFAT